MIDVAAGLVFRNGRILITQRPTEAHLGGLWEFPGGKRCGDESFQACLRRELREELGIEVEVGEWLDTVVHRYPDRAIQLKFYRCSWRQNEPQPLGCQACRWILLQELRNYPFPPADAQFIEKLEDGKIMVGKIMD